MSDATSLIAETNFAQACSSCGYSLDFSLFMVLTEANEAATEIGLPAYVLAWYTFPRGDSISIISSLPPTAAIGKPLPNALPSLVMSGFIEKYFCAPQVD